MKILNKIKTVFADYFTSTFVKYSIKWQLGIIVSWPCIYLLHDVLGWNNFNTIIGFQFVGALVFWKIDKMIFKKS